MIDKTIVCLASSRKLSKRCVAGKEIVNNQLTHNWIRPVSRHHMGELSETEIVLKNGKGPKILDIVTIALIQHQSHPYQTENYLIDHHQAWRKQSSLSAALLPHMCDKVESIWINGYHSFHGKNDKMPLELVTENIDTAIGDVRSHPYSKYSPQFSYEALKPELKKHNIAYVFLGKELGARTDNPSCYNHEGKVQYARMAQTENFKKGIERLNQGLESYRIAIMCAEKDPLMCHRTILIARHLRAEDMIIQHILEDGSLETQSEAEQRLMDLLNKSKQDLFATPEQVIEQAYDMQSYKIAYIEEETDDEQS